MVSPVPTRFPKGVNNCLSYDRFNLLGFPDPTKWVTYFDDFAGGTDSLPNATDANYVVTKTGAGTIAQADGSGGWSLLTASAANADNIFVQKKGSAFRWVSTKKLIFGARFKISDSNLESFVMGLQITDTTPLAVSDGIYFLKTTGAATVDFIVAKASVLSTAAAIGSVVTDTFIELAFVYNGKAVPNPSTGVVTYWFDYFINGDLKGSIGATTTAPDTQDLCISFGLQNGEAVAKTMTIDYIFAALER